MNLFATLWQSLVTGDWNIELRSPVEWLATILSIYAFYWCIKKRPGCFIIFLVADVMWFITALAFHHWSLVAQQVVYLVMDGTGYAVWLAQQRVEDRGRDYLRSLEDEVMILSAKLEVLNDQQERRDEPGQEPPGH
jgi:nicotinamide riboside transporter PnuC